MNRSAIITIPVRAYVNAFARLAVAMAIVSFIAPNSWAQDDGATPAAEAEAARSVYENIPQFGGPTSVGGQLAEDASVGPEYRMPRLQNFFEPWNNFKTRVNDRYGLQFNIDESILYQSVTDSLGETDAASGLVRVYGQWEPFRCHCGNKGLLVFKAEDRHRIGSRITPFDLGFEAGSILPTGTFFSEFSFSVTNLFWKQYFLDDRWAVAVGRIDVTDFIDVYAMINPLTHFINLAFSTNPTIAVPNQGRPRPKIASLSTTFMRRSGIPTPGRTQTPQKAGEFRLPRRSSSAIAGYPSSAPAMPMATPV